MRWVMVVVVVGLAVGRAGFVEAHERSIKELPKDVMDLALVWTEPIKQVVRRWRDLDLFSGLWFGLLEGSVKSLERTARFVLGAGDAKAPVEERSPRLLEYKF